MTMHPVNVTVEYPERLSRWVLLLKVFFGWLYAWIPHSIALGLYGIAVAVITFFAFWAILFTGRYPRGMFDFVVGYLRWRARVNAYLLLLVDEFPPFTGEE